MDIDGYLFVGFVPMPKDGVSETPRVIGARVYIVHKSDPSHVPLIVVRVEVEMYSRVPNLQKLLHQWCNFNSDTKRVEWKSHDGLQPTNLDELSQLVSEKIRAFLSQG